MSPRRSYRVNAAVVRHVTYSPGPAAGTVLIMANSGRLVHLAVRVCDVWVRRRWDLCGVVCWQLLLAQFGLVCLVIRALLVALGARRGGPWWERLALVDAVVLVLDAVGLPGSLLGHWVLLVVWLHRKAVVRRDARGTRPSPWGGRVPRGQG